MAPLIGHEVWDYDDVRGVQTLIRIRAICYRCSAVVHFGRSTQLAREGRINIADVVRHLREVNDLSEDEAKAAIAEAHEVWSRRNQVTWRTHFGPYDELVRARA